VAFSLDVIQKSIEKNIFKFLDRINKNKVSYIAMGKILTWFPKQDGVFGKIIYMPPPLQYMIGKNLSYNKPDIKGNYYRKKYFESFKKGKNETYLSYYFKNPETREYELKISYFKIYRPYNWVIVKGFYESQIENLIEKSKQQILTSVKKLFMLTALMLLVISLLNFLIAYLISKRIIKFIIKEYEDLENKYKKSQQELINRVYYDPLTSLPNRNKLLEDINGFKSLCIIDIDDFSDLNDIYGFETGDEVLKFVAQYLKNKYRHVYKIGSDEFAIGFEYKVTHETLREIVNTNLTYKSVKLGFTAGASYVRGKLFETAETALKLAYKDKSVKYKIYDESMQRRQKERLEKLQQLTKIVEEGNIIPYYQCIVNDKGETVKYEALMRIKLGDEILSPFQFMEFIKEAKLYNRFSRLMIKKIFEDLPKINKPVSINLSFYDISNTETSKFILNLLQQNEHADVVFEILETENIEQFDTVIDFILNVKKYGAKIAIDDFGSGYSNLVNILYLKPDYLKIDASLVKNIDTPMYYEIVKFIVEFANKFNIKTIAEFISDKEKFETLKSLGIDEFQGFYFCKPEPIDKLI
jgi:EAL domain-containing protein (putative c-di-GMP-specific phosphodiesterase class I)